MTQEQIRILKDKEYHQDGIVYGEGGCRDMIMSCLIYGTPKEYFLKNYGPNYVKHIDSWVGTNGRVRRGGDGKFESISEVEKIWDDQQNYFKNHCRVNHNVYTDSEGLSYNSITEF
jgi:hypothetical protein